MKFKIRLKVHKAKDRIGSGIVCYSQKDPPVVCGKKTEGLTLASARWRYVTCKNCLKFKLPSKAEM